VNPDLVVRDEDGKVMTVRYDAVNAMLLNEFLKEHRKVEEQGAMIAKQQKQIAAQQANAAQQQQQIEALAAGLQKVSAAVELNKAKAPQVAGNEQP
jgi:peptidoglycan hydrolase CwlO-like protein